MTLHRPGYLTPSFLLLILLTAGWLTLGASRQVEGGQAAAGLSPLCIDPFEPDNNRAEAKLITTDGAPQIHTLHLPGDEDWIAFDAEQSTVYTATTFDLALDTDTVLRLYDVDGATLLAINDDYAGSPEPLASQIVWAAPAAGRYFLMVRDYYSRGDCLGYAIRVVEQTPSRRARAYLPDVRRMISPTAMPTPTGTPTATPSLTPTATRTPTVTLTPTTGPTLPPVLTLPIVGMDQPNGVAVNPLTNRIYITSKRNNRLIVLEGNPLAGQTVRPQPAGAVPYALAFNPTTSRLYAALAVGGSVNRVQVYQATLGGLLLLDAITVGQGGADGGGGLAVNPATNRVYMTNSASNTVSAIDGLTNQVRTTIPVGVDPFGVAVNPVTGLIYVANRAGSTLSLFYDGP